MQAVLEVAGLPASSLEASAAFYSDHLDQVRVLLENPDMTVLAIVLPSAGPDHDDWRRTLARDLAREHAPKRANVVGGDDHFATAMLLDYLKDAPGVTGHYLAAHE